jgi:hypothetical protein
LSLPATRISVLVVNLLRILIAFVRKPIGGEGDGNNPNCTSALQKAQADAAQVSCPEVCPKQVVEIWRGWKYDRKAWKQNTGRSAPSSSR